MIWELLSFFARAETKTGCETLKYLHKNCIIFCNFPLKILYFARN